MNRTQLNATEKAQVQTVYNSKGQAVDPHTKQPLQPGRIDRGHKYGYEEAAMERCAEKCHMTQRQYNQMVKQNAGKIFWWEGQKENRSHKYECKDPQVQNKQCMKLIREYLNQDNGKSKLSAKERNLQAKKMSTKSCTRMKNAKGKQINGVKSGVGKTGMTGNKSGLSSGEKLGISGGGKSGLSSGGKSGISGGGKQGTSGGGKSAGGAKGR